jgi:hypothetical protein
MIALTLKFAAHLAFWGAVAAICIMGWSLPYA